jgi:hypothetical protein
LRRCSTHHRERHRRIDAGRSEQDDVQARHSGGFTGLGIAIEGAADYTFSPRFSINGYLGVIRGGDVVSRSFAGDSLTFGYLETMIRF